MIVCIPSLGNRATTGKAIFCERLAKALSSFEDVTVISNIHQKHDISLHVILIVDTEVRAKKVLRLDGVWHNVAQDFIAENQVISHHLRKADAVVYQSQFCRAVADRYLFPYDGLWEVIFNGADPAFYENRQPVKKPNAHAFIAYSRWRPHKRLLETIECYLQAEIEDSCLYVVGDLSRSGVSPDLLDRYFRMPNVRYLGALNQTQLAHVLNISDGSIHLCWIDACPNSVVEAIAAGLPVITNNVGGTQELVRPSGGLVCEIDEPWDLTPCDLYSPPPIDKTIVADAIHQCSLTPMTITKAHIDIQHIAVQYKLFFEKVLSQPAWV